MISVAHFSSGRQGGPQKSGLVPNIVSDIFNYSTTIMKQNMIAIRLTANPVFHKWITFQFFWMLCQLVMRPPGGSGRLSVKCCDALLCFSLKQSSADVCATAVSTCQTFPVPCERSYTTAHYLKRLLTSWEDDNTLGNVTQDIVWRHKFTKTVWSYCIITLRTWQLLDDVELGK